jgi:hypothetical protein
MCEFRSLHSIVEVGLVDIESLRGMRNVSGLRGVHRSSNGYREEEVTGRDGTSYKESSKA